MANSIRVFRLSPIVALACWGPALGEQVLLLPYFDSNGENGVYLAWSDDGRRFHAVNGAAPIFRPPAWDEGQHLTRDPSIVRHDGAFHMVWTSSWSGRWFGYATSPDLKRWSVPRRIQAFPEGAEQPKNVWAPELLRDHVAGDYKVIWSSTLPSELEDGDGSDDRHGHDHRMFYTATTDFETFTAPQPVYPDPGWSVIDAHVVWDPGAGRWVMALKKEVGPERGGKNVRLAFSPPTIAPASFAETTAPIVGPGSAIRPDELSEGPSLVSWRGEWLLFWDSYTAKHFSLASSVDLSHWKDETDRLRLPVAHPRHGTVFAAPREAIGWELAE